MDPFSVAKLGDVTIQRVPAKSDDSKPKVNKDCENEVISNNIASQILQLSKLSSSINITVKSNPSNSSLIPSNKLGQTVDGSELKQIQCNELEQIQTDPNLRVVSLGPGVELRKKENIVSGITVNPNTESNETTLTAEPENEERKDDNDDSLNEDAGDEENETDTQKKSVSSDFKNRTESEGSCDTEENCDKEMDYECCTAEEISDSKKLDEVLDSSNKEIEPSLEDLAEPSKMENVDDQEYLKNNCVVDEVTNNTPDISAQQSPADSSENVPVKEEQLSSAEKDSSESEGADNESDKEENDNQRNVPKKKKKRKPKSECGSEDDSNGTKKQKTSKEENADSESNDKSSAELKKGLLRKNIREVMDETKLEEATLAAQRQEMERLRRVQEQQKIIRDVQRQIAQNRQNSKMQARVLSLLQKGATSILKKEQDEEEPEEEEEEEEEEMTAENKPNTVVVKLSTGFGPPQIVNKKVLDLLKKQNSTAEEEEDEIAKEKLVNLSKNLDKPQMMTPSVSIAPIKHESKSIEIVNDEDEEKPKDVVMISSSSDEEDDCIVISEEDEESEPDEDPTNSGMHTNDLYNVPDEQGRVLINVGHLDSEKDVFLAPQIARIIKPHQIGGVRFLFDNIVESLSRFETSEGFGCILAHSMGLGKTLQVVSFCDVFLRYTEAKSVLCIMPINTLQNWVAEFNMWLPTDPENSPLKEQGEILPRQFPIFVLNDNQKTLSARAKVIQSWNEEGGVLLIGYELYRQLSLKKPPKSRNRSKRKTEAEEDLEDEKCKNMLECMYSALVKPGPDLVICDEGHRIKNSHASISQALKQIRSKRRVVLTGYPLQNNLMEYWCMVDFVRPNYLGTKTEFSNMFERPIQNGQCIDSTPDDIKLMRYRAHVLHSLLEGFVQRRSHSVLQQTLPTKYEYVLLLRLTPLQKALYNTFMNEVVRTKAVPNPLKAFAVCCKIWNHPDILYNFLKKRAGDEELDLDIEETAAGIGTPASGPSTPMTPSTPPHQAVNKRTRNRGGKAGKDAKLPRKNPRSVGSTQTSSKTPLIAAVPPNTANTSKSTSPERTSDTNTTVPFDSFSNQFPNFHQPNENFNEFSQSNNVNPNYNSQFGQEYASQNISNGQEYNGTNYQQNFTDSNFYHSGFSQNNYWPGNNESGNYFNSNTPNQPNEEYFQSGSAANDTRYGSSSEYGTNTENTRGNYNNSNYSFDMNSQMNYPNEFSIKPDPGAIFGLGDNNAPRSGDLMLGGGDLNSQPFSEAGPGTEMNFRDNTAVYDSSNLSQHFRNQNAMNKTGIDNVSVLNNVSEQVRNDAGDNVAKNRRQEVPTFNSTPNRGVQGHMSNVKLPPGTNQTNFNPTFGVAQQPKAGARAPAGRGRNNSTPGVRGRPRNNTNFRTGAMNKEISAQEEFMKIKPGLPGGAPVLKHGVPDGQQNFQNMTSNVDNQTHLLGNQMPGGTDELNMFSQNQMNANFLDSLRSDELWNPSSVVDQNTLFHEQNYMYDDANQMLNAAQNTNFMTNETPSLLGGVRAPRALMNEVQNNENLFPQAQPNYPPSGAPPDHDLFNYLNELNTNYPISSHTSFMGLLEGDDNLGMDRNSTPSDIAMKNTTFSSASATVNAPMNDGNFMESSMRFPNSSLLDQNSSMNVQNSDLLAAKNSTVSFDSNQSGSSSSLVTPEKDVNQSLIGLTRRGQITLKKIDKKNESQAKLNEPTAMEPNRLDAASAAGSDNLSSQQNQAAFQNVQSRLPSINIFNTSQNFVDATRMNTESNNFSRMEQFPFPENQASANVANPTQPNQTNWENYDVSTQNPKYNMQQSMAEKPVQFGFNQNQGMMLPKESSQYDGRNVNANCKQETIEGKPLQMPPYNSNDNRPMFSQSMASNIQENNTQEELHNQYMNSQNEHKKIIDEKSNKSVFPGTSLNKPETVCNAANKATSKMNPPTSISPKVTEKKQPQRRNLSLAARTEMAAKQLQNNESCADSRPSASNSTMSSNAAISKPSTLVNSSKIGSKILTKDVPPSSEVDNTDAKMPAPETPAPKSGKEEPGIPYDWTNEFFKDYEPGKIEASAKTLIFFCMLEEIIKLGDRLLLFSQSLFTLDLIEDFLQMFNIPGTEDKWARNKSYFRLDGSTSALEREKLINEFNSNPNVHLFLVSTRAGSLGINLVGANRVVVFDASWNPCHDTQAVCRVYRYGQQKSCYVYRFVMDNCLEKKIYDRQINKQGMSDRVVDECNPDAHLTIKDVSNLCWDDEEVCENKKDFNEFKEKYNDSVIRTIIEKFSSSLSKEPFQHESLLVDRKDKQLSQAEKRKARRLYEDEKKQANNSRGYPFYGNPANMQNRNNRPTASVRPMPADSNPAQRENPRRWIPAEVWQKQGMSAQEMTLPLDVVIPTNASDSRSSIVLKAGQKVMVLKSQKGIYMQLENGKIIAIKTTMKPAIGQRQPTALPRAMGINPGGLKMLPRPSSERPMPLGNRRDVTVSPIRNRFTANMRANANMAVAGMRPGFTPRGARGNQPIVRHFPLSRTPSPQSSLVRPRLQAPPSKSMFGRNSSVTISLANKKKMENQEHANMTEVNYEEYNEANRLKDMQHIGQVGKKSDSENPKPEYPSEKRSQFSDYSDIDERTPTKGNDSSLNYGTIQNAETSKPIVSSHVTEMPTKTSISHNNQTRYSENVINKPAAKFSDAIPESLRFKKDINLTPVRANTSSMKSEVERNTANALKSTLEMMRPKTNQNTSFQGAQQQQLQQQQQQQRYQLPQQKATQPSTKIQANRRENMMAPKMDSNLTRPKVAKTDTNLNLPESILTKKEVQLSVRNSETVSKSSSQPAISIFPVGKKQEDGSSSRNSAESSASQMSTGFENTKNAPSSSSFYGEYQKPYREYYQSGYSSNYSQHQTPEYPSQSQHSFGSTQYPQSVPYSGHDYGSASYSRNDNSQYNVNPVFSNQSHASSASNAFSNYDQYGWQNFPQQSSKTESNQHSPLPPHPPPPPSQQQLPPQ